MRAFICLCGVTLLAASCVQGSGEGLNNGERGEISLAMPGLPVEHQPFQVTVFVQRELLLCPSGGSCIEDEPIVAMAAGCEDESICVVAQQEPTEQERRCVITVDAHQAGETRLFVELETASGTVRRDTFPIHVTRPTSVEVSCPACEAGLSPGAEATAVCRLFNRELSADPLQGACEGVSLSDGLEVLGDLGLTSVEPAAAGPRFAHEPPAGARAFGNVFTVRKKAPEAGEVRFSAGDVERRITAH